MTDTYPSLFWAYTVIWGLLTVYIGFLGSKLWRLERRLRDREERKES